MAKSEVPKRKAVRLSYWNYAAAGYYYLTLCTHNRQLLFGQVIDREMCLNAFGHVADEELQRSLELRKEFSLDIAIIMPNHVHLVVIRSEAGSAENQLGYLRSAREPRSVSTFVSGYKAAVTARIKTIRNTPGKSVWQRGFHEHIIRTQEGLDLIREYIALNPLKWHLDRLNPNKRSFADDEIDSILEADALAPIET